MPVTKPIAFVSSTAKDLGPYRAAAGKAIQRAGFEPLMMEDFEAQSLKPPLPECLAKVDRSDVVVVIVAHRYGWVPPDQPGGGTKSITRLECEYAHNQRKEVLAFVVQGEPADLVNTDELAEWAAAKRKGTATPKMLADATLAADNLPRFKAWLDTLGTRREFGDPKDLAIEVHDNLGKWAQRHPDLAPTHTQQDDSAYLERLRSEHQYIDIKGLGASLKSVRRPLITDLYIPLTTSREPLESALSHRLLVIEGDPGSGKTTFLRRVAYELCRPDPGAMPLPARFPLWIRIAPLTDFIAQHRKSPGMPVTPDSPAWLAHFLAAQSAEHKWGLDRAFFDAKLGEADTLVLLDGLDEAADQRAREDAARLFEQSARTYRKCRFAVTTRPGSYQGRGRVDAFHEVRVDDLEMPAIQNFLRHWCDSLHPGDEAGATALRTELEFALRARPEIRRMARNPVMLTALAVVHWHERRLPEQRADLYESIAIWMARAREAREGRATADRVLTVLGKLALAMMRAKGGRAVEISKGAAAKALRSEFKGDEARAREFLDQEEVDSGLLLSRGTNLRFWHLTLQEFLAARAIAGMTEEEQKKQLFASGAIHRPEWRETVLLLCGILAVKQGNDKVDGILRAVLARTPARAPLADQARCYGLIGSILGDLRPLDYVPPEPERIEAMRAAVMAIFTVEGAKSVPVKVRAEAAEALGRAGDPRLKMPWDEAYWVGNIGRYPVTVWEYARYVEEGGEAPHGWAKQLDYPNRPATGTSWDQAMAYCQWASGECPWKVRLPREAEWQAAAAGPEGLEYPWGSAWPAVEHANYGDTGIHAPSPVGTFPLGNTPGNTPEERISDMAGNVWEWCDDWYDANRQEIGKAVRGGSWFDASSFLRASARYRYRPDYWSVYLGFRCVRE